MSSVIDVNADGGKTSSKQEGPAEENVIEQIESRFENDKTREESPSKLLNT